MIYRFGNCVFDSERKELLHAGELVNAEPKVLEVLQYLLEHRDRVVPRDELFEQCWPEAHVSDTALTSCLKRLRQAIGQKRSSPSLIQTVHRRGYRFVADVSEHSEMEHAVQVADGPTAVPPLSAASAHADQTAAPEPERAAERGEAEGLARMRERRQLTVLSCTLDDTDTLLARLDPEDFHEVIQTLRAACLSVIERYEGYVAQPLDAGVLVYFGYPQAREDDVQRAIHCGLDLVDTCRQALDVSAVGQPDRAVRVGIDTGLMIVTPRPGPSFHLAAVGLPATIAGRLGALTLPNTVAISAATEQLVEGYFDCKALGAHLLAGQTEPVMVYEVRGPSQLQTRLEVGAVRGLTPFVGREVERTLLGERWEQAQDGMGQVVVLSGDAGMGKSRLLQALKEDVAESQRNLLACRCSPYHQNTVLYPIVDLMERSLRARSDDTSAGKLERLEHLLRSLQLPVDDMLPLLAPLLSLTVPPERYAPLNLTPQRQRQQTLEGLLSGLLAQTTMEPLLFMMEDLHWADPSTLEYLDMLIAQAPTAAIMVVLTYRPTFEPPWGQRAQVTPVVLNRLTRAQVEQMVNHLTGGKALSTDVMRQIIDKTDGVPLFGEELTKAMLNSEQGDDSRSPSRLLSVPATLHDALMARLDQLGPSKDLAQWGAVIGREFSYTLLAGVTSLEEAALQEGLRQLTTAEIVFQRGLPPQARYVFKHALIQDTAYASILKRQRQAMHERIAQVLESWAAETVETQPEVLAYHYTEAERHEQAIPYWQRAGDRAMAQSAHHEAMSHFNTGLSLLATRPETEARNRLELSLQMALGPALMAIHGYGAEAVERTYARAQTLCGQLGNDAPDRFPVLRGLAFFNIVKGALAQAQEVSEQLLELAREQDDTALEMEAYPTLAMVLIYRGEFRRALDYAERGLALFDPQEHREHVARWGQAPGLVCLAMSAWALWSLGYPDQAVAQSRHAIALAQQLAHPYSLALTYGHAARLHQLRRDVQATQEQAQVCIDLCTEHEFTYWLTQVDIIRQWALMSQTQDVEGLSTMRQALDAYGETGAVLNQTHWLALLMEACWEVEQVEEGSQVLHEALAVVEQTGERYYEAELHRLVGEFWLRQERPDVKRAEDALQHGLQIAREQEAKSFELRVAMSLARLWQQQGKRGAARDLLAPVYHWFTEGLDAADLQQAKALLDEFRT
ncbi:MAG: hypothetical protein ETSY1_14565 [Candidatus Entotheonella factor]|uniref:OmpR/PhoB-type domain-containing protein n=1 Tax=Entotheonella factor TaxID=1429438 RepID=W4LQ61_ENTF1|nr:MAG: hypothetical protein ETSY1_14565 [Candidatus Entotheonella factor]